MRAETPYDELRGGEVRAGGLGWAGGGEVRGDGYQVGTDTPEESDSIKGRDSAGEAIVSTNKAQRPNLALRPDCANKVLLEQIGSFVYESFMAVSMLEQQSQTFVTETI